MPGPTPITPRIEPRLPPSLDPLGEVLQLLRLTGVLHCRAELTAPWGIELPALAGVMMVEVVIAGHCWLTLADREPLYLPRGSLALLPRGSGHRLRASPADPATPLADIPVELIGERFEIMRHGGGGESTRIVYCGVRFDHILAHRLLQVLPEVLIVHSDDADHDWLHDTVRLLSREAERMLPGHETVVTRLADILVIQAIRAWIERTDDARLGWIGALRDRHIGQALTLMHRQPATDWRVDSLAQAVGMSRAGFAARFTALVGEPVLHYLTGLRMGLAHRALLETTDSLAVIAERVGYHSEPAFHRAFRRVMGVAPGAVRRGQQPTGDGEP